MDNIHPQHQPSKFQLACPQGWCVSMLALLVVWGLVWGIFETGQGKSRQGMAAESGTAIAGPAMMSMSKPSALNHFLRFAQASPIAQAGSMHEYTQTGFYLLNSALHQVIAQRPLADPAITQHAHALQTLADHLDALPRTPVGPVRAASLATADLLAALQAAHYPLAPAQVDAVHAAALAIQPQASLHEQRAALQTFFQRSAAALEPVSQA